MTHCIGMAPTQAEVFRLASMEYLLQSVDAEMYDTNSKVTECLDDFESAWEAKKEMRRIRLFWLKRAFRAREKTRSAFPWPLPLDVEDSIVSCLTFTRAQIDEAMPPYY